VIFLPVAFMSGQVGRYFYSFGITSATAILISMFVSFTLTPALCAWWLRPVDAKQGHATQSKQRGAYAWMDRKYGVLLEWSLAHRGLMLGIAGAVVLSAALLYPYVGKELVPDDDQSEFSVNIRLPRGTSFERTMEYMAPFEDEIRRVLGKDVVAVLTNIGGGSGNYWIQLTPLEERQRSQQMLMAATRRMLGKYKNSRISVSGGTDISGAASGGGPRGGGGSTNRLNMIVQGPDIEQLQAYSNDLLARVRTIEGVTDAD
jgi:HAE1 family hydrophobic/amphiphilic exporter-1